MSAKSTFISRLDTFSGARRSILNASLRYRLGTFALACGIFCLIFLAGWIPSDFVNAALFVIVAAVLVFMLVRYVRRRERFRNHLHEAFLMEDLAGGLNSRVVSAFDFAGHEQPTPLMQVVIDQAQDDLKTDFESRLDRTLRNRYRKHFAGLLVIFLALGFTPWFGFGKLAGNFGWSFFAVTEYFFPLVYTIEPEAGKKHVHKLGEEVDVSIRFSQSSLRARLFGVYRQVALVEDVGGQTKEHVLPVDTSGRAGLRLKGSVEASHSLRFRFGERTSQHVLVVFASAPMLDNMQSELMYPAYTRMLPKSLEGIQDHFFGLPNTKITLGFTFTKDLRSAIFTWDDGEELPLDVTGRFASTTIVHSQTRTASLQVRDENGWGMEAPFIINFEIQPDEKPQVFLPRSLKNDMPTLAEGLKLFSFGARLEDDYGVSRCLLKWTKTTVSNPTKVLERGEVERLISPPRRKAMMAFEKCFENLAVQPGDKINFSVEVYDNRNPAPQTGSSPTRSLFVYQQGLEDLRIASLGFGSGMIMRSRISQSRRATSVKEPGALKTIEQVRNEYEAAIETTTKSPIVPGSYAQPVKDYFRLMSTAVERNGEPE
ncbi:MAG TPA: hypothetical protein VM223_05965 [Planctomycetota bacterium]|nr:hypothetical protein [Planctomycetota bacterium]